MMRKLLFGILPVCLVRMCAFAVDGFNWVGTWWASTTDFATDTRYWENHCLPSAGGVAYYLGANLNNQVFASPVTLRGLDFGDAQEASGRPKILGGELVLSGDAFISGSGRGTSGAWGRIGHVCSTVRGTGDNTLTKKGRGELIVDTPFADFGTLVAGGGRLTTTNESGRLFATDATLAWKGGIFRWTPTLSAGESASASTGATAYGPFGGTLMLGRGSGASVCLTLESLARTGDGATLWVAPDGGAAALGETERLFVLETLPQVNGLLDPGLVTRDVSTGSWPFCFTTYDSGKGIVPYPVSAMKPLEEARVEDVARVTASLALTESKRVAALVIDNTSELSIAEGATLSVGDDDTAHAAGVIFNRQVELGSALEFVGAGTLDFGASPGIIWNASKNGNGSEYVNLKTRITGSGGVTFASRGSMTAADYPIPTGKFNVYAGVGGWSGPTYVNGTVLFLRASNALPSGDIYVLNSSGLEGGELLLSGGISWSFSQNLHLAGRTNGSVDEAVLRTPPATVTFNGGVYLDEDASLSSYDPNGLATFDFRGGLFGPGALALPNGATVNLYSPATISGINGFGNVTLNVSTNGTLGTGRVWLRGGRDHRVVFTGQSGLVVDNEFRCDAGSLDLSFSFAKVALTRSGFFSSANLSTFSSLTLGADIDFGRINAVCSQDDAAGAERIVADIGGATLGVGDDGADSVFAVPLADGAGELALAKRGTCEVELVPAARTYSGMTSIEAGTLRLNDDPFLSRSLLYWLDADQEDSLTKDADGTITTWRSRGGCADVTFTAVDGISTWGANKVNGRSVVTTGEAGATRLRGDKSLTQNTVFVVYRIHRATGYMGLFGSADEKDDYGVRLADNSPSASTGWTSHRSDYNYNTTGWIRRDGGPGGPAGVDSGETHILTLVHDRDNWPHSGSWGKNTRSASFVPSLGYYVKGRPFCGDYCEVLAFDRVLTEVEMRKVENYLSEKWCAKTIWEDVGVSTFLPVDTALRIERGGVLDLAGQSLAVGSLTGGGVVTNSSAVPVTLTVTGAASFKGRIGGQTTLALQTTSDIGGVVSEGATLEANAGTVTVESHRLTPPTDGLSYWCDAAWTNTILRDSMGGVTSWVSRAVSSASALVNATGVLPGAWNACARPTYSSVAMDGKPGIVYEQACRALWADAKSPVRTVFLVVRFNGSQVANAGLWGIGGKSVGYRTVSYGASLKLASWSDCYVRPSVRSDRVAMDGIDYAEAEIPLGDGVTRVFSVRLSGDAEADEVHFANLGLGHVPACTTCIGSFDGNSSIKGAIGEVIAYDRVLSDGEMRTVESYLMSKWQMADWKAGDDLELMGSENGLAEGSLSVRSGATVRVPDGTRIGVLSGGGGTIAGGDLTVDGIAVAVRDDGSVEQIDVGGVVRLSENAELRVSNAEVLRKNVWWPFLTATTLEGVFATHNLPKGVSLHLSANAARLLRAKGTLITIR